MTSPGPQGYPDWGRLSARANALYLSKSMVAGTSDGVQAPIYVGNQPTLGLFCTRTSGNWSLDFEFYNDVDLTTFLGRHEFDFNGNTNFLRSAVTVLGPFLSINAGGAAAGSVFKVTVAAVSQQGTYADRSWANILIGATGVAIGAGATGTQQPLYMWPGNAFLCYQAAAQPSILQLDAIDFTGAARPFWRRTLAAGAKVGEMVTLPASTVVARVTNTGAAADTYDLYLTGQHHIQRS